MRKPLELLTLHHNLLAENQKFKYGYDLTILVMSLYTILAFTLIFTGTAFISPDSFLFGFCIMTSAIYVFVGTYKSIYLKGHKDTKSDLIIYLMAALFAFPYRMIVEVMDSVNLIPIEYSHVSFMVIFMILMNKKAYKLKKYSNQKEAKKNSTELQKVVSEIKSLDLSTKELEECSISCHIKGYKDSKTLIDNIIKQRKHDVTDVKKAVENLCASTL